MVIVIIPSPISYTLYTQSYGDSYNTVSYILYSNCIHRAMVIVIIPSPISYTLYTQSYGDSYNTVSYILYSVYTELW